MPVAAGRRWRARACGAPVLVTASGGGESSMRRAHEVAKVRAAEGALMALLPDGALMQRAAFGLASVCARLLSRPYGARVIVLAGSGDNGGDALYAGALLARRGAAVHAITAGSRTHPGGAGALRAAGGRLLDPSVQAVSGLLREADLIADGMLGVGGKGGLRDAHASLAWLAVGAAVRGGAGMVRLVSAGRPAAVVRQDWPEAVITVTEDPGPGPARVLETAGRVQAWAAGPGMGTGENAAGLLREVLACGV